MVSFFDVPRNNVDDRVQAEYVLDASAIWTDFVQIVPYSRVLVDKIHFNENIHSDFK